MPIYRNMNIRVFIILGCLFLFILPAPSACLADSFWGGTFKADSVLIKKSERKLYLLKDGKVFRDYQIALGKDPQGAKLFEGDNRTPEGEYCLDWRNSNSAFYKSIHISYPNADDIAFARVVGENAGGGIMIHGLPENPEYPDWTYVEFDWTDGCIAVSNEDMDEIWESVEEGTPIQILP
jgi:murein L,D-transpeptidase YafK